jgi:hypothetical protein
MSERQPSDFIAPPAGELAAFAAEATAYVVSPAGNVWGLVDGRLVLLTLRDAQNAPVIFDPVTTAAGERWWRRSGPSFYRRAVAAPYVSVVPEAEAYTLRHARGARRPWPAPLGYDARARELAADAARQATRETAYQYGAPGHDETTCACGWCAAARTHNATLAAS